MILTVTNTKGGVGKTTTAVNLAAGLARKGRRTLLVDLDPQAHATRCFLREPPERDATDLIMEKPGMAARAVTHTDLSNLDVVAASGRLNETAELLAARIRREERLSRALDRIRGDYRHVVIDCPPSLGILTHNGIVAGDLLLVPVQPGAGAVSGIRVLLDAAGELRDEDDVPFRILVTMLDLRTSRTNALFDELLQDVRKHLLRTFVARSESINQANLAARPVLLSAPSSRGAWDYESLCDEIVRLRVPTPA
jgi:chromosome partitioning protein